MNRRNIALISLSRLISELGSVAIRFALSLYILDATGSPFMSGVVFAATYVPGVLVNIFAGVWIDRSNKKRVLVLTDLLSGAVTLAFLGLFVLFDENVYLIVPYVFALYTLQALFMLALNASIPEMVAEDKVMAVNSNIQSISSLINIFGIFLGASVYLMVGLEIIVLLDGITFLISGIVNMFFVFRKTVSVRPQARQPSYLASMKNVYAFMSSRQEIKWLLFVFVAANFLLTPLVSIVLLYIVRDAFRMVDYEMAYIEAAFGVGVIAGALLVSRKRVSAFMKTRIFLFLQLTALTVLCWLVPAFVDGASKTVLTVFYAALMLLAGAFNCMVNIPIMSYVQVYVPEHIRASILGVVTTIVTTSVPIGLLLFGMAMEWWSWVPLVAVSGIAMIMIGFLAHRQPALHEFFSRGLEAEPDDAPQPPVRPEGTAARTEAR
jgi:MFS family permease